MRPRFRVFASFVALVAFSASFAEGVWASTCEGMESMDAGQMEEMAVVAPMGMEADHMMAMSMLGNEGDDGAKPGAQESQPRTAQCPLTAAVGSCAVISLPSYEPGMEFVRPVRSIERGISSLAPDLLLAAALLRPPRA